MLHRPIAAALAFVCMTLAAAAQATYPAKPVRLIVPSPAGGGTDTIARAIGEVLSRTLGRQFVVENKPGAGNVIGTDYVAKSTPDGYTLLVSASPITINHLTTPNLPFDTVRDFAPVTMIVQMPSVLVADPGLGVATIADLVKLAKAKPGALNYGSAGIGTNPHISMELLKSITGTDLQHVPYKGIGASMTDILGGRLCCMIINVLTGKPQIDAGRVRALGVTSLARFAGLPSVPSLAEAGVKDYESLQWYGMLAPAGTPAAIVALLHAEVVKALALPDVKARMSADGAEPVGSTPEAFAGHIKAEIAKWTALAKVAKLAGE